MNNSVLFRNTAILSLMLLLTSCEVVEGIFKAGIWSGIILVVLVIGIIVWLLGRMKK